MSRPMVMGILNVTPDSFYDGGRYMSQRDIERRIETIITEGADIIDIGAYSTRAGAREISEEDEWQRLQRGLKTIYEIYPEAIVSVDTFRSGIARRAVDMGAAMINDISGGDLDSGMYDTMAELHVPYVVMHMQGTPRTMQESPSYDNVTNDVISDLSIKVSELRKRGVKDIIIDPGFGFGKKITDNYQLLNSIEKFAIFEKPIMVGVSRKSMIYKTIGTTPEESLNGTTALNAIALIKGASILRVHDVREAVECVKLYEQCYHS